MMWKILQPSFRGTRSVNSDTQLRIGEPRDSGFDATHRPGMTENSYGRKIAAPVVALASSSVCAFVASFNA